MSVLSQRPPLATLAPHRRLLIIESGAPPWVPSGDEDFDETIAVTQIAGEQAADFAERALLRLAALQQAGRCFSTAEFVVGFRHDEAICSARRRVALAIAEHARGSQALSELVAVVAADVPHDVRESLVQLNDDLVHSTTDKELRMRLRRIEAGGWNGAERPGLSRTNGTPPAKASGSR